MSSTHISIKPNNHKVHPCPTNKKEALIYKLVAQYPESDIIVVSSQDLKLSQDITVMNDKDFILNTELTCDVLISYDLPTKAAIYPARVSKARQQAVILLDESEQKDLYPIEMLLGRAIKQELIEGFEYEKKEEIKAKSPYKKLSADEIKDVAKKRYDAKVNRQTHKEKPYTKPDKFEKKEFKKDDKKDDKKEFKKSDKFEKKPKKPNKFLGKDENGKAIFSGKSGERNHRYDGTPRDKIDTVQKKTGRKINIKSLKKSKD